MLDFSIGFLSLTFFFFAVFGIWMINACTTYEESYSFTKKLSIGITGLVVVTYCFLNAWFFTSIRHWWYAVSRPFDTILVYNLEDNDYEKYGIDFAVDVPLFMKVYYQCDKLHDGSCKEDICNKNCTMIYSIFKKSDITPKPVDRDKDETSLTEK